MIVTKATKPTCWVNDRGREPRGWQRPERQHFKKAAKDEPSVVRLKEFDSKSFLFEFMRLT